MQKRHAQQYDSNIFVGMATSQSEYAKTLVNRATQRVVQFLEHVTLNKESIEIVTRGDGLLAEQKCLEIFRYGWLNPKGEFIPVGFTQHEEIVAEITGYDDCDSACVAGWLKFTVGLPYDYNGWCLFDKKNGDRRILSVVQKKWLNNWIATIGDPTANNPSF